MQECLINLLVTAPTGEVTIIQSPKNEEDLFKIFTSKLLVTTIYVGL